MAPKSILECMGSMCGPMSAHLNIAALSVDPLERMKHVITSNFSYMYVCHKWEKPLNPILGETYQARLADGTNIFLEQICHKPPISYILFEGPDELY